MQESQRTVLTKRLFHEALLRLLKRKSIHSISVSELCREAGLNRATFYRHYDIPSSVLEEILAEEIAFLGRLLPAEQTGSLEQRVLLVNRHIYDRRSLYFLILRDQDQRLFSFVRSKFQHSFIRERFLQFVPSGQYELFINFLVSGLWASMYQWVSSENPFSPEELTRTFISAMRRPGASLPLQSQDAQASKRS